MLFFRIPGRMFRTILDLIEHFPETEKITALQRSELRRYIRNYAPHFFIHGDHGGKRKLFTLSVFSVSKEWIQFIF
jgi:hypothetical protein